MFEKFSIFFRVHHPETGQFASLDTKLLFLLRVDEIEKKKKNEKQCLVTVIVETIQNIYYFYVELVFLFEKNVHVPSKRV